MDELLPCPFCGSREIIDSFDGEYMKQECAECGAAGPEVRDPYKTTDGRRLARKVWNQRTFTLFGRPVIESDDLVTSPIIVGGHLLEPGETIAEVLDRIDDKPTP